jgi:GT2 family glycosyltransferase
MRNILKHYRELLGVIILDWWGYEQLINKGRDGYLEIRNRTEKLAAGPDNKGYVCLWPFTSKLHAASVWPYLGKRLLKEGLDNTSFIFRKNRIRDAYVDLSIIVGHRGMERLPHLLCTLSSLAGQSGVSIECIVVEQDSERRIQKYLPPWVEYAFQGSKGGKEGYNRSAAFNFGAEIAKGRILLLHDNDMLVPETYCKEIRSIVEKGYQVVNPKRFVYYLTKRHSETIMESRRLMVNKPEYIVQNLEAGGSVAITKEAYLHIGGMDESFVGWGGEDNEFWWRCSILNKWIWGFAPILHLWHESQPLKGDESNDNLNRAKRCIGLNRQDRIKELKERNRASLEEGGR